MPNTSMSVDDPRTVQGKSSVREEKRREEKTFYVDGNVNRDGTRANTKTQPVEKKNEFEEWIVQLIRRSHGAWPGHRWSRPVNREYANALAEWPQATAEHAINHAIRTRTSPYPPPIAELHQACQQHAAEQRRERQARATRALEAQLDREAAPPWYSHLYTAVVIRSAGLKPREHDDISHTPFLQIVKKYDINPGETAPATALREAEAAWIHAGKPPAIEPADLIAHSSSLSDAPKQA